MPHLTIECSANVAEHHDIQGLVDVVHAAALDHGLPPLEGLRTRAAVRPHYRVADGAAGNAFVAITARIGPGRSLDDKRSFLEAVLDAAEAHVGSRTPLAIAWSIEITELDPQVRINRNRVRERLAAEVAPTANGGT